MNIVIILIAKYLYVVELLVFLISATIWRKEEKLKVIKLMLLAAPLTGVLVLLGSHFIYDPRPFVVENIKPLIPHDPDNGFPSDHTLMAMFTAFAAMVYNKKIGIILLILAFLVGVSRVMAKVHHPIDIIGSIFIAFVSITISYLILKKLKLN